MGASREGNKATSVGMAAAAEAEVEEGIVEEEAGEDTEKLYLKCFSILAFAGVMIASASGKVIGTTATSFTSGAGKS